MSKGAYLFSHSLFYLKNNIMNLENYGGNGWGYPEDNGSFEVRYEDAGKDCLKTFTLLSEAKEFYDSLDCERFAWDLTHGAELIDGMYIKHKNNE